MSCSNPPTILIAEDETHIVFILEAKLSAAGFDVVVARNGRDALAAAHEHRPALAITDLNMPLMDGLEFAIALRGDPATAGIPVIMLTGRGHTVSDDDRARTNIRVLESKPFSARHLLAVVQDMVATPQPA